MKYLLIALASCAFSALAEIDRVEDVLSRMTLDEKLGQLRQVGGRDEAGLVAAKDMSKEQLDERFYQMIEKGEYGSLIGCRGVKGYNDAQRAAMKGRLGIPLLIGHDMIHGAITDYPIPLGISAAWDTNLWYRCARAVGPETWLKGANWTFAPMLDIARDARWGRIAEGPGQDPYLAELYGYWWTLGLQGEDMSKDYHLAACAKHYVGYGAAEGGRDYNAVEMSESTLRNVYLPSFRGAIRAGLATVMPAFHTWNDVPCSINRYLLTDVLRGELGFKGFTISDWEAVWEVRKGRHGCAADDSEIAAKAINAGMDMEMLGGTYRRGLKSAVLDGRVPMAVIDEAVRRILRVKCALGLFDHPLIDEDDVRAHIDFVANRRLAREAAQKSTVLLKNTKEILPLKQGLKIALVGSLGRSANEMRGCWAFNEGKKGENMENATLEDGLKANGFEVIGADCYSPDFKNRLEVEKLKAAIQEGDVVVACFGENLKMNGENRSRANIALSGEQNKAVEIIRQSGKPFVAVLFNGRPLAIPELVEACDALVEAWNPGSAGGWGVADVMCGAVEPTGRLTVDFPKMAGECPKYYNRLRTGRAQQDETDTRHPQEAGWLTRYLDTTQDSTFVFGEGLAYTTFAYANEKVEEKDGAFVFTADITNTGKRIGTETVQLYTRDPVAQISRPRRELKRFEKVTLKPGETKGVRFVLKLEDLGYWCGRDWMVEKGEFYAWIAPNSNAGKVLRFNAR